MLIIAEVAANLSGIEPRKPKSKPRRWYTVAETAAITGLSPWTLRTYTRRTDLVRGADFYVHHWAYARRRLYFTPRGIDRLIHRRYRCGAFQPLSKAERYVAELPWSYDGKSIEEKRQRLNQIIRLMFRQYMIQPCAVPNCPCMIHRLGVPQAAEVYEVFPPGGRKK